MVEKRITHEHCVDIKLIGSQTNGERYFIECMGKSYAKSDDSIHKEGWLNAYGQIVTRMESKRIISLKTYRRSQQWT